MAEDDDVVVMRMLVALLDDERWAMPISSITYYLPSATDGCHGEVK